MKLGWRERLLQYGYFLVARINKVIEAGYEGERDAFCFQEVGNLRVVSSTDIYVQKDGIEIALGYFLARHGNRVRDAGNTVTSLSDHFLDHQRNQKLVIDYQNTRRRAGVRRLRRKLKPDSSSLQGGIWMGVQHDGHRRDLSFHFTTERNTWRKVPSQVGVEYCSKNAMQVRQSGSGTR